MLSIYCLEMPQESLRSQHCGNHMHSLEPVPFHTHQQTIDLFSVLLPAMVSSSLETIKIALAILKIKFLTEISFLLNNGCLFADTTIVIENGWIFPGLTILSNVAYIYTKIN